MLFFSIALLKIPGILSGDLQLHIQSSLVTSTVWLLRSDLKVQQKTQQNPTSKKNTSCPPPSQKKQTCLVFWTFVLFKFLCLDEIFFEKNQNPSLVSSTPPDRRIVHGALRALRVVRLFVQLELYKCQRVEVILVGETQIFFHGFLGGGFKDFLFPPLFGEDFQFD